MDEDKRAVEVLKTHRAIAIAPSPGSRITLVMRKFFNVLMLQAQAAGPQDVYRVNLQKFLGHAGVSETNREIVKAVLRSMVHTTVEWNEPRESADGKAVTKAWGVSGLLAYAEVKLVDNRSILEWSYSPIMRDEILNPFRYVPLSLNIYASFKRSAAAALYEICARYLTNIDGRTSMEAVDWWMPRLTGVSLADSVGYSDYKFFKSKVLKPALLEINDITDISVEMVEKKAGRKVTHLQFLAKKKPQQVLDLAQETVFDDSLLKRIEAMGVGQDVAMSIYTSCAPEDLMAALGYVEKRVKAGTVNKPGAFLRDAIKKGYGKQDAQEEHAKEQAALEHKRQEKKEQLAQRQRAAEEQAAMQESAALEVKLVDALMNSQESWKAEILKGFESSLHGLVADAFRKNGTKSKIVRVALVNYLKETGSIDALLEKESKSKISA